MKKFVELTAQEAIHTNGGGAVTGPVAPTYIGIKIGTAIVKWLLSK